jgi:WD40 repeat protein
MIYDETDPEESKLIRRVLGGHKEEITILAFDYHLSLMATGCINGEIAVYDFEMSKIEGILHGHDGDITALEFMSPYPILISASMDCTVCIWGIKGCPSKL